jgi:plasmid stabilization system protein ParE
MSDRVRITRDAAEDLDRRLTSLAERSPEAADRLNDRFEAALIRLLEFPLSCGLAHEHGSFDEELRHLLFWTDPRRKYRALFVVRGDEVLVLAVRAPGERPVRPGDIAP